MIKKYANGIKKGKAKMAEMKNSCSRCVHEPVCKYTEAVKKSMYDIAKIANDHFEAHDFNGLIDLSIQCRQYAMAPYQELKINRQREEK